MDFEKKYESDKFVINETNLRSYTLARVLGGGKCKKQLVLFQGSYGNGKTRLMKMIIEELEGKNFTVKYMEPLYYYESICDVGMFPMEILDEMESVQVLIMEDIDVLDGKIIWQKRIENFIRIMLSRNIQVILTSNKSMIEIDDVFQKLLSETYVEQINDPDEELKKKILKEWVKEVTCEVPERALEMIWQESLSIGKMKLIWHVLKILHEKAFGILDKKFVEEFLSDLYSPNEKQEIMVVDLLFHEERYSDSQIAEMVQVKEKFVQKKREAILRRYPVRNNMVTDINNDYVVLAKFWGAKEIEGHKVEEIEEYYSITEKRRKNILKRIHIENRQIEGM